MKIFNSKNLTQQAGVSLAETMIVVVILGALSGLTYSQFGSSSSYVQVRSTLDASEKIAANWSFLAQTLGTSVVIAQAPAPASKMITNGKTPLDLVIMGDDIGILNPDYSPAYSTLGLRPLSNLVQVITAPTVGSGGDAGAYAINDCPITLSTVSNTVNRVTKNKIIVSLTAVRTEIAYALWGAKANKKTPWKDESDGQPGDAMTHGQVTDGLVNITLAFNP
jgi:hypothetical protein